VEHLNNLIDIFLHLDEHLNAILAQYGTWTYLILFGIIFAETGLVVAPFLPGDSLLFATGALTAGGPLNIWALFALLTVAAILGDTVNYWIGSYIGPKAFTSNSRFLKREYLERTHRFYEKHGGKTIILARFLPIIRTFAPFIAGIGRMSYARFLSYNIIGGVVWIALFLFAGYFFGNLPAVKDNFSLVILGIIVVSFLPGVFEFWKHRREVARAAAEEASKKRSGTAG
jgi:membrane-associated protein